MFPSHSATGVQRDILIQIELIAVYYIALKERMIVRKGNLCMI